MGAGVDSRGRHIDGRACSRSRSGRPWWASATGFLGAILLHAALISALTLGTSADKPQHRSEGGASSAEIPRGDRDLVSAIIYLDPRALSSAEGVSLPRTQLKALSRQNLREPRLVRLAAQRVDISDGQDDAQRSQKPTATTPVDGAEQALLFGRYVSQIAARIDRAWVRPQTAPSGVMLWARAGDPSKASAGQSRFECRVEIVQSRTGQVLEVTLLACDSSPAWQMSLVNAINAASPLPSPPSASVFARALVLSFTSAFTSTASSVQTAGAIPE